MGFSRHPEVSAAVTKTYKCGGGSAPGQRVEAGRGFRSATERAEAALSPAADTWIRHVDADGSQGSEEEGVRAAAARTRLLATGT